MSDMMPKLLKSILAVVVGVIVGCNIWFLVVKWLWPSMWEKVVDATEYWMDQQDDMPAGYPVISCIVIALPLVMATGLPAQALLQRLHLNGYLANVGVGVMPGALPIVVLAPINDLTMIERVVFGFALCLAVSSIIWLIRRPDKDAGPILGKPFLR